MQFTLARSIAFLSVCLSLGSGCAVPDNMHVATGLSPKHVNDQVRFRTTYYFRTFDYCWDADVDVRQDGNDVEYRKIIPQTDTLYRYRMTGKASSLFNKVRFESGVLKEGEIDPFGTQVTFSEEADGFYIRSNTDVRNDAIRARERKKQRINELERVQELIAIYDRLDPKQNELREKTAEKISQAMDDFLKSGVTIGLKEDLLELRETSSELKKTLKELNETTRQLSERQEANTEVLKQILDKTEVAVTVAKKVVQSNLAGDCPIGSDVRKGFQIMGPEGIKTFDQTDRLVLAMSSSAKPLIATLKEYSGRINTSRVDRSAQLLAITNENLRVESAQRALSDALVAKSETDKILQDVIDAFRGKHSKDENNNENGVGQ